MTIRIIPVLDLKDGVAVHAVRGDRAAYAPVRSVLADSADPVALARAFMTRLGCRECYVADLDAIAGRGDHAPAIRSLVGLGLAVWLDAGIATAAEAERALSWGVARVIVGTETLGDPGALPSIAAAAPASGCLLSLDLRHGRLLGGSPAVERLDPVALAREAWHAGIRAFIVLDLARVGGGPGGETGTAITLRDALPRAEIIVGGGVRDAEDLRELAGRGFDGALVATALHTGAITSAAAAEKSHRPPPGPLTSTQ
jgi:phosphoribosylformimino-5-aminoimidazole carboxamide ribotide isomerase